jgi:hypothetical protein
VGRILAHPGYFYEMPGTHLVMTFVEELEVVAKALERLVGLPMHKSTGAGEMRCSMVVDEKEVYKEVNV